MAAHTRTPLRLMTSSTTTLSLAPQQQLVTFHVELSRRTASRINIPTRFSSSYLGIHFLLVCDRHPGRTGLHPHLDRSLPPIRRVREWCNSIREEEKRKEEGQFFRDLSGGETEQRRRKPSKLTSSFPPLPPLAASLLAARAGHVTAGTDFLI